MYDQRKCSLMEQKREEQAVSCNRTHEIARDSVKKLGPVTAY